MEDRKDALVAEQGLRLRWTDVPKGPAGCLDSKVKRGNNRPQIAAQIAGRRGAISTSDIFKDTNRQSAAFCASLRDGLSPDWVGTASFLRSAHSRTVLKTDNGLRLNDGR